MCAFFILTCCTGPFHPSGPSSFSLSLCELPYLLLEGLGPPSSAFMRGLLWPDSSVLWHPVPGKTISSFFVEMRCQD